MKIWMVAAGLALGLAACTTTSNNVRNDAYRQIVKQTEAQTIYFDENGAYSAQKVNTGFYRKVLGRTQDGHAIVQDFYSRNDQKQSDPLKIVSDEGLKRFDNQYVNGEVVLYYANGAKMESSIYDNGKAVGQSTSHYPKGTIFSITSFSNGQLDGRSQYFHADGKLAANLEYLNNTLTKVEAWDDKRQPVNAANMAEFLANLQKIDQEHQLERLRLAR